MAPTSDANGMKRTVAAYPTDKVVFGQTNSMTFSHCGTVMSLITGFIIYLSLRMYSGGPRGLKKY